MLTFQKAFVITHSLSATNVFKFWMKPKKATTQTPFAKAGKFLDKAIPLLYNPKFNHALVTDKELPLVSTPRSIADDDVKNHTKAFFLASCKT